MAKMKWLWIFAILILVLAGCGGSAAPSGGQCNQGLCVKIEVAEPIRWGEPVTVTITVIAEREISDLGVWLNYDSGVIVESPEGWEAEVREKRVAERAASWKVDVKTDKPLVFVRRVHLPLAEREFGLSAAVYRADLGYLADSVRIYLTREGGKAYYEGKPLPTLASSGIALGRAITSEGVDCSPGPCLTIRVVEPVRGGEPVQVILQVDGKKEPSIYNLPTGQVVFPADFPNLGLVFASSDPAVQIKPEKGEFRDLMVWPAGNGVWWVADVWADSTQVYTFQVTFPAEKGLYYLGASAYDLALGKISTDSVAVEVGPEGGKVFAPSLGTPFPTATPWPTPLPTPTSPPSARTPTPTQPAFISPLPTPTSAAYP